MNAEWNIHIGIIIMLPFLYYLFMIVDYMLKQWTDYLGAFFFYFFPCAVELKKQSSCSVRLTNNTHHYVAFKV